MAVDPAGGDAVFQHWAILPGFELGVTSLMVRCPIAGGRTSQPLRERAALMWLSDGVMMPFSFRSE
jgi:hypothetical protein